MDPEKCCCNWKVTGMIIGCIEILLSFGLGTIFGAGNLIFGEVQMSIVIFLICFINIVASLIWFRGIALEEIRFLLTSTTWWIVSMCLWLLWMILDKISGVEFDGTILFVTVLIVTSHLAAALCFTKLKVVMQGDKSENSYEPALNENKQFDV
ncbi:uncharacterized protein LOC116348073 [Contarinia nasturtii]|uniref:uncharacterized protein LOC116348073 n=1 Tax=Contarinia nasturtii TaxID=265458 RepID=UPI0012D40437|nr:uncharacterized protein LOC116348073 [Contarinia nasturtii]